MKKNSDTESNTGSTEPAMAERSDPLGDGLVDDMEVMSPDSLKEEAGGEGEEAEPTEPADEEEAEAPAGSEPTLSQAMDTINGLMNRVNQLTELVTRLQNSPLHIPDDMVKMPAEAPEADLLDPEKAKAYLDYQMRKQLSEIQKATTARIEQSELDASNLRFIDSHPAAKEHGTEILAYMEKYNLSDRQLEQAYWAVVGPKIEAEKQGIELKHRDSLSRMRKAGIPVERPSSAPSVPKPPPGSDRWPASKLARWYTEQGIPESTDW